MQLDVLTDTAEFDPDAAPYGGTRKLPVPALRHVLPHLPPQDHLLALHVTAGHGEGGAGDEALGQDVAADRVVVLAPALGTGLGSTEVTVAGGADLRNKGYD